MRSGVPQVPGALAGSKGRRAGAASTSRQYSPPVRRSKNARHGRFAQSSPFLAWYEKVFGRIEAVRLWR